jgi:hypothetical protein
MLQARRRAERSEVSAVPLYKPGLVLFSHPFLHSLPTAVTM